MRLSIIAMAIALAGCSTTEYAQYASTQTAIATSRATAETSRYDALARIAESGDSSARIAAVMAIAMGQGAAQQQQIAAPVAPGTTALQWASVLVPGLTQVYGIQQNAKVAINSSNNAMLTSSATTAAFVGIAGKIQAPVVTTPQANVTTTTSTTTSTVSGDTITSGDTLSGTGVLGSGTYSTQANPVTTTTTSPVVVPDVVQIVPTVITPIVVPDVVQITPVVTP